MLIFALKIALQFPRTYPTTILGLRCKYIVFHLIYIIIDVLYNNF